MSDGQEICGITYRQPRTRRLYTCVRPKGHDTPHGRTCGAVCPYHGGRCPTAPLPEESLRTLRQVFGPQLNQVHSHLCLAAPDGPHSWREDGSYHRIGEKA